MHFSLQVFLPISTSEFWKLICMISKFRTNEANISKNMFSQYSSHHRLYFIQCSLLSSIYLLIRFYPHFLPLRTETFIKKIVLALTTFYSSAKQPLTLDNLSFLEYNIQISCFLYFFSYFLVKTIFYFFPTFLSNQLNLSLFFKQKWFQKFYLLSFQRFQQSITTLFKSSKFQRFDINQMNKEFPIDKKEGQYFKNKSLIGPKVVKKQSLEINSEENQENFQEYMEQNGDKTFLKQKTKAKRRVKSELWENRELKKIFNLYNEYGSQWKLISNQFPERSPNSIKNRFYTTLRLCLKAMLKQLCKNKKKLPQEISSKALLKIYEAQGEFSKFKGFFLHLLKEVNLDAMSPKIPNVVQHNKENLQILYKLIFDVQSTDKHFSGSDEDDANARKTVSLEKMIPESPVIENEHNSPKSEPSQIDQPLFLFRGDFNSNLQPNIQGFVTYGNFFMPAPHPGFIFPFYKQN